MWFSTGRRGLKPNQKVVGYTNDVCDITVSTGICLAGVVIIVTHRICSYVRLVITFLLLGYA